MSESKENKEIAPEVSVQEQSNKKYLTGRAKVKFNVGAEIINKFFSESSFQEIYQKKNEMCKILDFIESKKEFDIADAIEIVRYASNYAANVKN